MARQHVHNRRAGRGGGGSSWISYSDIMAALVMVFVLFLVFSLYHYGETIRIQTEELDRQRTELAEKQQIVIIQQAQIDSQTRELDELRITLGEREEELSAQTIILVGKMEELDNANATLAQQQTDINNLNLQLAAQQAELDSRQARIEAQEAALRQQSQQLNTMVGVRSEIVQELSGAMRSRNLNVTVDSSGSIILETSVLFSSGSSTITADGQSMLQQFLPVYLDVLMRPEYADFLGEIIIEGHTDSDGTYENNMTLSLNRANAVAAYCLQVVNPRYRDRFRSLLVVQGRSEADLIMVNGVEDKERSRRVVFKFRLKDEEMVTQMNEILQQNYGDGAYQIVLP